MCNLKERAANAGSIAVAALRRDAERDPPRLLTCAICVVVCFVLGLLWGLAHA